VQAKTNKAAGFVQCINPRFAGKGFLLQSSALIFSQQEVKPIGYCESNPCQFIGIGSPSPH
jgi:hypothetical protein